MGIAAEDILVHLQQVEQERQARALDGELGQKVLEVKRFQHARFASTYADFLDAPGTAAAARFFLDDLYGPSDFVVRDRQFARAVPAMLRVLPKELVSTVRDMGRLHALTEQLDTEMGRAGLDFVLDRTRYRELWRRVGRATDRELQIQLMLVVGRALDSHARKAVVRSTLRLMRIPAQTAGFGALQRFLETGIDAFKALPNAEAFLCTIADRERKLAAELFA